ncbi:MAG: flgF [Proteobacteria bacterium]|nr:flgF [Pseudomonadota bacterium]
MMRLNGGNPAAADASVRLVTGALESSNVSAVEEMTQMIQLQRQYEMQLKLMKTVEEDAAASSRLMQIA